MDRRAGPSGSLGLCGMTALKLGVKSPFTQSVEESRCILLGKKVAGDTVSRKKAKVISR